MRILGIDHGEKRIGLAISDETGTLARPLAVIAHVARAMDAAQVAGRATAEGVGLIVIGQSFDEDGNPNAAGKSAARFAEALRQQTDIPIQMWDESLTTQDARSIRRETGRNRKQRSGHLDDVAAAILLQDYLDAR